MHAFSYVYTRTYVRLGLCMRRLRRSATAAATGTTLDGEHNRRMLAGNQTAQHRLRGDLGQGTRNRQLPGTLGQ